MDTFADDNDKELVGSSPTQKNWRGILIALLVILIVCSLIVVAVILVTPKEDSETLGEPFTFDDMLSEEFQVKEFKATWVGDSNTYVYLTRQDELMAYDADNNDTILLMDNLTSRSIDAYPAGVKYYVSSDLDYILVEYDKQMLYRHSFTAKYLIYDRTRIDPAERKIPFPTSADGEWSERRLQFAGWSPKGHQLSFVYENNLYHQKNPYSTLTQVTENGRHRFIYNGIADWLYEEEVLGSNVAHWWSPDGNYLCYAMFNDTNVPQFTFPFYGEGTNIYGSLESIAYPKAGDYGETANPTFKLFVVETSNVKGVHKVINPPVLKELGKSHYFTMVRWRDNGHLMVAWSNRAQNRTVLTLCDVESTDCTENIEALTHEGKGWVSITEAKFVDGGQHYLTILPHRDAENGYWKHVTLVTAPIGQGGKARPLTHGLHEVTQILGYDETEKFVYYTSTNGDPRKSHVFRTGPSYQPTSQSECLTCDLGDDCQYNKASFSPTAEFYILECRGPGIPKFVLLSTKDDRSIVLEDNAGLRSRMVKRAPPLKEYFEFTAPDGTEIYGQMFLPPTLKKDHITQYPLLIHTYNGPSTQLVTDEFRLGYHTYLASQENVIYVSIDGRGTGGRGDRYLHHVYHNLGAAEVQDQITGAEYLRNEYPFVDRRRIGIWGWSYGGFVTVHALGEPNSIFQCGVAVAPVTDWRYYDTAYTERYMGFSSGDENYRGYDNANASRKAVNFVDKNFLLVHGTADDNVHFQHSAQLMKALIEENVDYRAQVYADKNHFLSGADQHLYRTITKFLKLDCWDGGEPREIKPGDADWVPAPSGA